MSVCLRLLAAALLLTQGRLLYAQKLPIPALLELAQKNPQSPDFQKALVETLGLENLKNGTAVDGHMGTFIWAIESKSRPALFIDFIAREPMRRLGTSDIWFAVERVVTGTSHRFLYVLNGENFGGKTDVAAFTADSYEQPNVPQGKLSEKIVHTSKLYDGMQSNYWIYVPAQYNASTPAALMVWQDGQGMIDRNSGKRYLNTIDNLIAQKKIPVMISVLIQPGTIGAKAMRSIEYDTVSDKYATFLRDEILQEVYARYNIRKDSYSRAIGGASSGGICAFNVAWQQPDQFSRVISWIGSFTSIQWDPQGGRLGGNDFPFMIRKLPKRNIRVWLQDGSEDLENEHGSWPLQNIEMFNSLKRQNYDVRFSLGNGTHNQSHGSAELPAELTWLWRGYDPAKAEQTYEMDTEEKVKPLMRVRSYNRDISVSEPR